MTWFDTPKSDKPDAKKESSAMIQKFFGACLLLFGGVLLLVLTIDLLSRIWVWIALAALIIAAVWIGFRAWQSRRNRW